MAYIHGSVTSAAIHLAEPSKAADGSFAEILRWFSEKVAKRNEGIRIVRVPSPDGSIVRFLVAPADRFKDELLPAQRARQIDAGALPPEIYGHDLFEVVNGNVVRLRDGSRVNLVDVAQLRTILDRFFTPNTYDNRVLGQCIDDIREGQRASRKSRS